MSQAENEAAPVGDQGTNAPMPPAQELPPLPETPKKSAVAVNGSPKKPITPAKVTFKEPAGTPRLRKKIPWKGKNILVLLPRDEERGHAGHAPKPLTFDEQERMYNSWEELGYSVRGFDLESAIAINEGPEGYSQSRPGWPTTEDIHEERSSKRYQVTLPDLNAWRNYVDELNEAKLRALGVSFGDEEPAPQPAISPAMSHPSQQASAQYPPLPFSPPLPTSSASSNPHAQVPGFPFPAQFMASGRSSAAQTPGVASPGPFPGHGSRFNPRQSISIPMGHSPFQPGHRASPSLAAWPMPGRTDSPSLLHGVLSPLSPFSPDGLQSSGSPGFNSHQRHQSLQFPMLPHQQFIQQQQHQQQPARASPRLQELREVDEDEVEEPKAKSPEPAQINDEDLQAEIDEAEYHLEEQMRNELEHEDYSPHNEEKKADQDFTLEEYPTQSQPAHSRDPSVQFQAPLLVSKQSGDGPVLHHPRPHSRGHSLTKSYFQEEAPAPLDVGQMAQLNGWADVPAHTADEQAEIETNPSNLGTPVQDYNLATLLQQQHSRNLSTTSNPWQDSQSVASNGFAQRRSSHGSRPSHGSKPSMSKLNVNAPEFKFNPGKDFQPSGQFVFGAKSEPQVSFQDEPIATHIFQAGSGNDDWPQDVASPHENSFNASVSSNMNVAAVPFSPSASTFSPSGPVFSPGHGSFSFSSSGPKFRPDAPAFTPFGGMSDSYTSAAGSGNESGGTRPSSIFGNLNLSELVKPHKKSKAIPIVRPSSRTKSEDKDKVYEDENGRATDESRAKRTKAYRNDGDSIPLFAEPTPSPQPQQASLSVQDLSASVARSTEDDAADTTMSSTAVSENHVDSRAFSATSPSDAGRELPKNTWAPFEFKSAGDGQSFNEARPFGEDGFKRGHKKSLSATAQAFVPGGSWASAAETEEDDEEDEREREATIEPTPHRDATVTPPPEKAAPVAPLSPPQDAGSTPSEDPFQMPAFRKGLGSSRFASPPPKPKGLKASRFASPPKADPEDVPDQSNEQLNSGESHEPTFEEIDAIMDHLNQNDPTMGVNKAPGEEPHWHQPSPTRQISIAAVTNSSPYHLEAASHFRDATRSPSPRKHQQLPNLVPAIPSTELEDPFVDPPKSAQSFDAPVQRLNGDEVVANSDWDGTFSDEEQEKLEQRVQFFDGRVNDLVGDLLNARLQPLEKTLLAIERHFAGQPNRAASVLRRDRRSTSAELQESDADDEDEEPMARRSMSPRRDRRMEQIRAAVADAFSLQQQNALAQAPATEAHTTDNAVLKALEELSTRLDQRPNVAGEDLRSVVEEIVQSRMPVATQPEQTPADAAQTSELQAKIKELEERLYAEKDQTEKAIKERRDAEELADELNRKLHTAETRVEVEIMNRSVYDQRIGDLEDRLKQQESRTDEEIGGRRAAEDRLSEVQRLLRISSEEEERLREGIEERDQKLKAIEQTSARSTMRMSLLEAAQNNSSQSQSELSNRFNIIEADLREARKEAQHYKSEFERVADMSRRHQAELSHAQEENKQQQRFIDTLGTQLQENERVRETWRSKFTALQEEMTEAAHKITEENARRTKKEQALIARQEVLDAKLQAEARTRERIETELERLENGERQGLRAISEMKRLEELLVEMRSENHKLQQAVMRHQREFEEARESGASEVQRTRRALQAEIDSANHQVNVVRQDMEEQISKLQADLDQANVDVESAKAKADMLVEEAQNTTTTEVEQLKETHANQIEDLHTRHAMQLGNTVEEAQKNEQLLLERLSLSSSKTEHLQDRVSHLEEKLEIAKEAALAAAKRAKSPAAAVAQPVRSAIIPADVPAPVSAPKVTDLPEKISPQALRESIMVLQEQLQAREQQIEELEQKIEKLDPEAPAKIAKRDDEITWLRELLAVRHGDLQDIIRALSSEQYDKEAVKDAAIRLKANLQMEEQERERAMNGASAINLPSIAQTLQNASPRVAQAVGPLAAAWGNWRKSQQQPRSMSGATPSPSMARGRNTSTPSRSTSAQTPGSSMSGLLTPPASGLRLTPTPSASQPTAFANTGRRLTSAELAKRANEAQSSRQADKMPQLDVTPPRRLSQGEPVTPLMMRSSAYDSDAHAGDFDDNDFFEED